MTAPNSPTPSAAWSTLRIVAPALILLALAAAGVGIWWQTRGDLPTAKPDAETTSAQRSAVGQVGAEQSLLGRASQALKERRLLTPAGDNAVEYYVQAMRVDDSYAAARLALLELIGPATTVVKGTIASGDLPEAQRQFALLQQMGASELSLGPLRAQMEAARLQAERAAALADAAVASPAAPAPEPVSAAADQPPAVADTGADPAAEAAAPAPTPAPDPPAAATVATPPTAAPATESTPAVQSAPADAVAASAPTAAAVQVVEPRQLVEVRPAYPAAAVQRRMEGWVELEVDIDSSGEVRGVSVVRSEPPRVFDREAVRAAQRWRFEPRRENGVAVASRVRKTLSFKLGAG